MRRLEKIQTPFYFGGLVSAGNPAFRLKFVGKQPEGWVPRTHDWLCRYIYLTKNLDIVEYIHYEQLPQKHCYY